LGNASISVALEAARKSDLDIKRWSLSGGEDFPIELVGLSGGVNGRPHIAGLNRSGSSTVPQLLLASVPEEDRGNAKSYGRDDEPESKKGYRVGRSPLPEGFAFFTLMAGLVSGLLTLALLYFGRRVGRLPSKYSNPKHGSDDESKGDFRIG
jgi:hypothetical protein